MAPPLVCNVGALTPAQRQRSLELLRELRAAAVAAVEIADGYAFRYGADVALARLGEWIELERRCCPFFRFQLEVEGDTGPVWLRLTGPDGVKAFLAGALATKSDSSRRVASTGIGTNGRLARWL